MRLDQLKRERANRQHREEFLQYKKVEKSKLKAFKAATDSACITVRTDNKNDDSNKGRKRQRSDADRCSAVQPGPPRKKIPPLAGAGTSRDDEQRRKVLRKEWLRVLKFEHTHLLLDMIECLMSRQVDRYYLLALQIILIVFPEFDHNAVLETLPAMMRNAVEETVKRMWIEGPKKVYIDYPAEGSKDERTECWKQRAELYHGIEIGIDSLEVGIFAVCQKGPDGLPPGLHEKVESTEHCSIFTDHFAVNMRRAACVFEMTQLPGREMEFLIFILNEMIKREAETSKKLEEDIARLKERAKESDGKLEDLQKFLDGIGTGTTEAISMQNAADELLEEDVDSPSKPSYTNSVLDGFREKVDNYESEIQGLKSARDTFEQELNDMKDKNGSLTTEMEEIRVSRDSLKDENHQLQAQYNAALEEVKELKGTVATSNQKLVDREVILKEQLEMAQIELKQKQAKPPLQTQDAVDIAQLQDTVNKLTLELAHWNRLYAELFSGGSDTESMMKSQSILELTRGLKCDIEKLVESNSVLKTQADKIEEADRTAELESRNAVLQARVADLEKQFHSPPPDINMSDAVQQQAEGDPNDSLHIPGSSAKESVTTTITVGELKKMSEELQDVNSRLEIAVQVNASLQTKSAKLENEAEVLKANLHTSEHEIAKLQAQCEGLRYPGLLKPVPQIKGKETFIQHSGTQTMHEAEDGRQLKEKITYIERLESYIKGLDDTTFQEKANYMLIQKQKDDLASQLLDAKHKACKAKMAAAEADRQIAELQATIKAKELIIEELECEVTIKGIEHGSMQQELDTLLSQRNELQQTASSNKNDYERIREDMKQQIDQLKKQVQDEKENRKNNVQENERILQEKITSINDLQRRIKALEDNATREKQNQQLMENEKDELASQLCESKKVVEAVSEKLKKEIQDLQGRNLKLKSDVEEQANNYSRKNEEVDKELKDLIERIRNLEDEIKNARASLADKDQELQSMKTAHDISEQVTYLQDTIERKESEILTLKKMATEQAAKQESMRNERENLLSRIADLHQKRKSSKKEHGNSVKRLVVEIAQLWNQLDSQAQSCIEANAELSTSHNEHASQVTKLTESSELTQSRNELHELQNQLQMKDKELARLKMLLDHTEEKIKNSEDEMEKRHSIIENLPASLATLRSTVDDIQGMVSAQQQSTYNAKPNCGSLQPEKCTHKDDSKSFADLRDQIQNLEHSIVERCAKNDLETKVRELQDKIMNLERSGDLLKAEVLIAAARREDAEAEAAKWVDKHKFLEDRLRKTEAQQLLDAKLKVEFDGQESIKRIYEGSSADGSIPALMTEISENNKILSLFFERYQRDVDEFKSLHRRLETLDAELRDVERRVDNCTGVLGPTSMDHYPHIVNLGMDQPGEKLEWRTAKKVGVLIEKAQLKIRSLESALEAKESEAELAALQSEMAVQEADPMRPYLWEEVPSGPKVATTGSELDLSFHTPESIHTPIKQHTEGIKGTQYGHQHSAFNPYPPLSLRTYTEPEPAEAKDCQPVKRSVTDRPALEQRTRGRKTRNPSGFEEDAGVEVDKSLSDLERLRMSVLLHYLSAILPAEKASAALGPLAKSGHIYSWAKIGKRNQDQLNTLAGVESAETPETLEIQLHNALA
ncbi:hydroxymethylglutaryl-coenzyme A reductase, partial [Fusarium coicis]